MVVSVVVVALLVVAAAVDLNCSESWLLFFAHDVSTLDMFDFHAARRTLV